MRKKNLSPDTPSLSGIFSCMAAACILLCTACGSQVRDCITEGWISGDTFRVMVSVPPADTSPDKELIREKTRSIALKRADSRIHDEFFRILAGGSAAAGRTDYPSLCAAMNTDYYDAFRSGKIVYLQFDTGGGCTLIYQVEQKGLLTALKENSMQ